MLFYSSGTPLHSFSILLYNTSWLVKVTWKLVDGVYCTMHMEVYFAWSMLINAQIKAGTVVMQSIKH